LPVKTTLTSIASRPADGQAAALLMSVGRASSGHAHPAKTTSTAIASGLGPAPSKQRLDNRKLMVVAKPSKQAQGHLPTHETTHERTPGSCFWSRSVEVSVPPWRRSLYSSLDLMQWPSCGPALAVPPRLAGPGGFRCPCASERREHSTLRLSNVSDFAGIALSRARGQVIANTTIYRPRHLPKYAANLRSVHRWMPLLVSANPLTPARGFGSARRRGPHTRR